MNGETTRGALGRAPVVQVSALAACLAASAALLLCGCGCGRDAPPTTTFTRGSVKVNMLLSIHPGWSDVLELDQLISHVAHLQPAPALASIPLPEASFPAPMTGAVTMPPSAPPPPAGSRRAASERITRLRESLNEHSDRVMARERAAAEKRLEAEVAVERSRVRAEAVPPGPIARNPADQKELRALELEFLALETQIRVLFEPKLTEVKARFKVVTDRIRELRAPRAVRMEVQEAAIEKKVEEFRSRRRADIEKELETRATQVRATASEAVAAYRNGLRVRLQEATSPAPVAVPSTTPMPNVALESPARIAAQGAAPGVNPALGGTARLAELRAQRARMVKIITEDLTRRIDGLAGQYHWTLVPPDQPGTDLTPQAADLLRRQFGPVTNGSVFTN